MNTAALDQLSSAELDVLERQIAGKYMGMVPWGAIAWGLGNCAVFIALFPLVQTLLDLLPQCLGSEPTCAGHTERDLGLSALSRSPAQYHCIQG